MKNLYPKKGAASNGLRPLYSKDVALITNRTARSGARLLEKIRKELGKRKGAIVTVAEFCTFMTLVQEEVLRLLT